MLRKAVGALATLVGTIFVFGGIALGIVAYYKVRSLTCVEAYSSGACHEWSGGSMLLAVGAGVVAFVAAVVVGVLLSAAMMKLGAKTGEEGVRPATERSRGSKGESPESPDERRRGRKVSDEGTTVFAFKAYTSEAGALLAFEHVVALGSEDQEARIRKEARNPQANVVVVEPPDWDAPSISSLAQADIVAAFPRVVDGASAALSRAFGVQRLGPSQMVDHGVGAMPHPTGHVLFLFAIPGHFEWAGEGASGAGNRDLST